jgi:hypothetical protein
MKDGLDDELRALGGEAPPADYDGLEARVWRDIGAARQARQARQVAPALLAVRVASVVGALGLGAAAGGATAVAIAGEAQEVSAFSVEADLAPSTLLDHHS